MSNQDRYQYQRNALKKKRVSKCVPKFKIDDATSDATHLLCMAEAHRPPFSAYEYESFWFGQKLELH